MRLDIVQRTEEGRMGDVIYVGCDVVVEWVGFLIMLQHSSRPYLTQDFGNQRAIEEGLWILEMGDSGAKFRNLKSYFSP